jgi:hypothetical protein
MTTGRINQVAFLRDADARMRPDGPCGPRTLKTGAAVVRVEGRNALLGQTKAERPRTRA